VSRGDLDAVAEIVAEGFETFRGFAPEGWQPPSAAELSLTMAAKLPDPDWWCLVEEVDGAIAGTAGLVPGPASSKPSDEPGLAHLFNLFVRPPHWGSGMARRLHAATVAEAAARGFTTMRLFTPAEQARARRFYEREGWSAVSEPFAEPDLGGLAIVEYRRPLP
jgi:GNAT superfamily N-acetyltransferase